MQAAQIAATSLFVEELDREQFDRLRPEWDALAQRCGRGAPFFSHLFLRTHLDNFEYGARLRVLVCREAPSKGSAGRLVAALPLIEEQATLCGIPVKRLRSPSGVHSNRFDLLFDPEHDEALPALWRAVAELSDWDVLELRDVPAGGHGWRLWTYARREEHPVGAWESMRSPYIPLDGGHAAVLGRLDAKFKANLRRRRRKLEERGKVELQRVEGGAALEHLLEEGFLLESSGWKGREGTAIACDPVTRGFYAEYARKAALHGELSCYFLRVDGRAVGFHYGLTRGSTYILPKMAYDEELKECSPGQLVMDAVLQDCCARGLKEFDFLGPLMPWKQDWTDQVRLHHWLYVFARTRKGRALEQLKFRWVPVAREVVGWKR